MSHTAPEGWDRRVLATIDDEATMVVAVPNLRPSAADDTGPMLRPPPTPDEQVELFLASALRPVPAIPFMHCEDTSATPGPGSGIRRTWCGKDVPAEQTTVYRPSVTCGDCRVALGLEPRGGA